ncbi:MAG: O-antigen ligase family protein [Thermodesulfobacteriota bacterium]
MADPSSVLHEDRPLSWGARLAIGTVILCQFVQVDLFVIGATAVSLQKVSAAILLPVSIFLMREWLKINPHLCLIAGTMALAYSANGISTGTVSPKLISANVFVLTNLFASLVLFTALVESKDGIRFLARVCIAAAVISAIATVGQVAGVLPWQLRGTGFRLDPNFQALVLVVGMACASVYAGRWRFEIMLVIMAGILATYSRMGIVAAGMVIVVGSFMGDGAARDLKRRWPFLIAGVIVVAGCFVYFGHHRLNALIVQRFGQGWDQIKLLMSGQAASLVGRLDIQSAEIRVILMHFSFMLACRNWMHGIGPFQTEQRMYDLTGFPDSVNNTPLDMFLIGGVWGLLAFCVYWLVVISRCVRLVRKRTRTSEDRLVVLLALVMGVGSLLLSLTYNSIWWLLPTVALAAERVSSFPAEEGSGAAV